MRWSRGGGEISPNSNSLDFSATDLVMIAW